MEWSFRDTFILLNPPCKGKEPQNSSQTLTFYSSLTETATFTVCVGGGHESAHSCHPLPLSNPKMKKLSSLWLGHQAPGDVSSRMRPMPFTIVSSSKALIPLVEPPRQVLVVFYCLSPGLPALCACELVQVELWGSLHDQESVNGAGPPFC